MDQSIRRMTSSMPESNKHLRPSITDRRSSLPRSRAVALTFQRFQAGRQMTVSSDAVCVRCFEIQDKQVHSKVQGLLDLTTPAAVRRQKRNYPSLFHPLIHSQPLKYGILPGETIFRELELIAGHHWPIHLNRPRNRRSKNSESTLRRVVLLMPWPRVWTTIDLLVSQRWLPLSLPFSPFAV